MKNLIITATLAFLIPAISSALEVGDYAPCVVLEQISVDGAESESCIRHVDEKASSTIKVLEFFSAVCSDCQKNLPTFSQIASEYKGIATFRLVGLDRSETLIRDYIKSRKNLIHFDVALDTSRDAKRAYGVVSTPTLFVLDANDIIIYKHKGVLSTKDANKLREVIEVNQ